MKLKNLNLYSDNITIIIPVYDDLFIVKCNRTNFYEIKNYHLEVDEIIISANNDVYIYSALKNYNVRFVIKAFDKSLTVMTANVNDVSKDDFLNYLNA